VLLLLTLAWADTADAKKCPKSLANCPEEGCGGRDIDENLNRRKNVTAENTSASSRTLRWMKDLPNPDNFRPEDTREELAALGEGEKISVVGYLVEVKPGSKESCNCGLGKAVNQDNHLVLVSRTTVYKSSAFASREPESVTAEFTPRVRLDHPNFTRALLRPMVLAAPEKALLVRVTSVLMFDSEHYYGKELVRVSDWEIHPILKLCTSFAALP
jgi:hypothetical protein